MRSSQLFGGVLTTFVFVPKEIAPQYGPTQLPAGSFIPAGIGVPGRRLVRSEMALVRGEDRERRRDVEAVGLARLALEALDRLDLLGGAVVLALARHLDPVLLRELVPQRAFVGPIRRFADDVEATFLLRLLDQAGEAVGAELGRQRGGGLRSSPAAGREKACDRAGRNEAGSAAAASYEELASRDF